MYTIPQIATITHTKIHYLQCDRIAQTFYMVQRYWMSHWQPITFLCLMNKCIICHLKRTFLQTVCGSECDQSLLDRVTLCLGSDKTYIVLLVIVLTQVCLVSWRILQSSPSNDLQGKHVVSEKSNLSTMLHASWLDRARLWSNAYWVTACQRCAIKWWTYKKNNHVH
jgi:hypothetical protein